MLLKKIICIGSLLINITAGAESVNVSNLIDSHTTRTILLNNTTQKNWKIEFSALTEQALIQFTDFSGRPITTNNFFPIQDAYTYGFSFKPGANFDIIYSITAISFDTDASSQGNPKCVFLFTALGPAIPENSVNNFAGAQCQLQRDSSGKLDLILDKK